MHHSLPGGVRLRLPHRGDADSLRALCERHGVACDPDALLHFDPREHAVVVAVAWSGGVEALVGIGAVALDRGATPELLIADDDAVREHLRTALTARIAGRPVRRRDHPVRRAIRRARQL